MHFLSNTMNCSDEKKLKHYAVNLRIYATVYLPIAYLKEFVHTYSRRIIMIHIGTFIRSACVHNMGDVITATTTASSIEWLHTSFMCCCIKNSGLNTNAMAWYGMDDEMRYRESAHTWWSLRFMRCLWEPRPPLLFSSLLICISTHSVFHFNTRFHFELSHVPLTMPWKADGMQLIIVYVYVCVCVFEGSSPLC